MHIKYILTHPIQYQSPLIKYLVNKRIQITVLYRSNISVKKYYDNEFKKKIKWDVDLLSGYNYKFLKHFGKNIVNNFLPITTDFNKKIFCDADIIWVHNIKNWYNLIIVILAKYKNKKVFIRNESNTLNRSFFNNIFNLLFFKLFDNFIDAYLSIGTMNKKFYLKNNIKKNKIFNVPYVVDNNLFLNKKKFQLTKKITFLFAGKLIYRKGADLLLTAICELKKQKISLNNTKFIIIGDGVNKKRLIKFSKHNNLTNVQFLPFQNYKDLKTSYNKSDVFIIPSRTENWGLTINEAMAAGNAIISSEECGASYDLIKNNINGYTFVNNDAVDLSKKIKLIIKNKNKINNFKKNSIKIITKWNFQKCFDGLNKAINYVNKK